MPPDSPTASAKAGGSCSYSYAVIRLVPRVERGECLNVGVILFARELGYLVARIAFDAARLRALAPDAEAELDLPRLERQLASIPALCAGDPAAGPLATLPPSERFHWLTAPRSTVIQTTPVHVGRTVDPERTLGELVAMHVGMIEG